MAGQRKVICLGSAACQAEDLAAAAGLGIVPGDGWDLVAVNHAARDWPGDLANWATLHPELYPRWVRDRAAAGRAAAGRLWTGRHKALPADLSIHQAPNWGGSSGLMAVSVAINCLGADKVVCIGIPLDHEQGHFDEPDKKWRDAVNYRKAWVANLERMVRRVKSMSGWTRELLGEPTADWLAQH